MSAVCKPIQEYSFISQCGVCVTTELITSTHRFAASVFPTVVKYVLKLFAMSVLSVQGTSLDVINVSVTVVFCFCFSVFRLLFPMFSPIISMHVKFIFEVIFLCNSDDVG